MKNENVKRNDSELKRGASWRIILFSILITAILLGFSGCSDNVPQKTNTMEEDAMKDDMMEEDAMKDDMMEEGDMKDDMMEEDDMKDDMMEKDSMK